MMSSLWAQALQVLHAALYAAKNGASVLLLDKKREIGSPIQCAGFLPDASEVQALLPDARTAGFSEKLS